MNLRTGISTMHGAAHVDTMHEDGSPPAARLLRHLHQIGPVLACARPGQTGKVWTRRSGILASCSSKVRGAGPREWILLESFRGLPLARVYLLPDSDFCAWDALCRDFPARDARPLDPRAMSGQAWVIDHLPLRGLQIIDPRRLSPPGQSVARAIAAEEACQLENPGSSARGV